MKEGERAEKTGNIQWALFRKVGFQVLVKGPAVLASVMPWVDGIEQKRESTEKASVPTQFA